MAAYFQMGHHSENLVGEKGLEIFNGILLSPVNRLPTVSICGTDMLTEKSSGLWPMRVSAAAWQTHSKGGLCDGGRKFRQQIAQFRDDKR